MLSPLSLRTKYRHYFPGIQAGSVLKIFLLLHCILSSRTICLYKCRDKIAGTGSKDAKYARLVRLFKSADLEKIIGGIGILIADLLFPADRPVTLVMDRTNWKFGNRHVNLLVLGFLFCDNRVFIPLVWMDLGGKRKRGNSSHEDRKALIDRFLDLVGGKVSRFVLLADREFIGADFWGGLKDRGLRFAIRIRQFTYLDICSQCFNLTRREAAAWIRQEVARNGRFAFDLPFDGRFYRVVVVKNRKIQPRDKEPEYLFLLSDLKQDAEILAYYAYRWKIESCFKHLKTNGFNVEEVHFKEERKITCLFAIAALAYVFAVREALIELEKTKPIPLKRYTDKVEKTTTLYPAISIFRYGYQIIQNQQQDSIVGIFLEQNNNKEITVEGKTYLITEISV